MQKYSEQQYNEIFQKLPPEIKDAIASSDTVNHITVIGKKHNLHIDKIGDLVDLTYDVMMGIVGTKDFVSELQNALGVTAIEASILARDIDENVFKPVKEVMLHLYAGRAPYRPSSSLVEYYEEDEDHPALSKDNLLKEIEDPAPAKVKKETVVTILPTTLSRNQDMETFEIITPPKNTEITPYHEEIRSNSIVTPPEPKLPEPKPVSNPSKIEPEAVTQMPPKPNATSILDQLASVKLSQAFVMPKGPEGIRELGNMELQNTSKSEAGSGLQSKAAELKNIDEAEAKLQLGRPKTETPAPKPISDTPKPSTRIDPYREPI